MPVRSRQIIFDVFAVTAVIVAGVLAWPYDFGGPGGRVLYVGPQGSDWWSGTSAARPLRTIQRAADLVRPGDRVKILPGVYQERIHLARGGLPGRPVVFAAERPGTVTVAWSQNLNDLPETQWTALGAGLFVTRVASPVYRLTREGQTLFRVAWGGLPTLRRLTQRLGAFAAFCYEDGQVHVFLPGGQRPEDTQLVRHRPVPQPREWGEFRSANVWVEADHLEISGLQFEDGIGSSILLWNAEDVAIRDCAFTGASVGVQCRLGIKPARDVLVERCLYHNYPQFLWRQNWLSWDDVYGFYSASSLVQAVDEGTEIRDCLALHVGDALRLTSRTDRPGRGLVASGNWLAFGTDDAIELDGLGCGVTFTRNLVLDCHVSLGVSPVISGPTHIVENLFLHPKTHLNGAQIKLLSPWAGTTIRNVQIDHNFFLGNWLCWWDQTPVRDVRVHDNLFAVRSWKDPIWPAGVEADANSVVPLDPQLDTIDGVPAALGMLRQAADAPARGRLEELQAVVLDRRPGPSWWDDQRHPATRMLRQSVGPR